MFLFALVSNICVVLLNAHTVEICAEISGTVVNFYGGTYHNDPQDGSTYGALILSNGPQGNGRKEFTSVVIDDNERPDGVNLTNISFVCSRCSNYGSSGINWWQYVQVTGLSNGVYDVTTSTDGTNVEDPYCNEFPSITISNLETELESPSYSPTTEKPSISPTTMPTLSCGIGNKCPNACDNDPCNCTLDLACIPSTCHADGCAQCQNGYFKKDYNYPCTSCDEVFGSMCMYCTDFLGCQQCEYPSVRVYDEECGLYYCENETACIPTPSPNDDSSSSNKYTQSPTRSPTEEESDDELEEESTVAPVTTERGEISSTDDCIYGYFTVDSISDINDVIITDYDFLLGEYSDSTSGGETIVITGKEKTGSPIYTNINNGKAYQNNNGDFVFESPDGSTTFTLTIYSKNGTKSANNLYGVAGTNLYHVHPIEDEVYIDVLVYDCDGNSISISISDEDYDEASCDSDCIDVSGMTVDPNTDAGAKLIELFGSTSGSGNGSNYAFNGRYCYDNSDDCQCYVREREDGDEYTATLGIDSDRSLITFEYCLYFSCYIAYFSQEYSSDSDFACSQEIDSFFTDSYMNGGYWNYTSDNFEFNFIQVTFLNNNNPTIEFDDCIGADFYCGLNENGSRNKNENDLFRIVAVIHVVTAAVIFMTS